MRNETRKVYNAMLATLAVKYDVSTTAEKFTATPPMAQKIQDAIQSSAAFLNEVSLINVEDMKGQIVDLTIHSTIAGRTDTTGDSKRNPQLAGSPKGRDYECTQTDFDVAIDYALLDQWARYPDFARRYMNAVYRRIALDRILIGFYGMSAAATTNRTTNPLLQDVNFGWMYDLITNNPENYMTEGATAGKIRLGDFSGADYKNVDQMVYDILQMIPVEHLTGNEVVILGKELVAKDMNKVLGDHGTTPSEKSKFELLGKSYGGLKSLVVPQFPARGVLITDPKNLQIYVQNSSVRRFTKEQPEQNRVADFISQNEAYRIADLEGVAGLNGSAVVFE